MSRGGRSVAELWGGRTEAESRTLGMSRQVPLGPRERHLSVGGASLGAGLAAASLPASLPAGAFLAAVRQKTFWVEHALRLLFQNPGVQAPGPRLLQILESSPPGVNLSLIRESVDPVSPSPPRGRPCLIHPGHRALTF